MKGEGKTREDDNEKVQPLPRKENDLGSFTIQRTLRNLHVQNALLDLGANINLIPLSHEEIAKNDHEAH